MLQWKRIQLATRLWVWSLALLSGLRILRCHELCVGCRHSLDSVLLWLWYRLAAVALIRPLAWEPPYAAAAALKRQKKIFLILSISLKKNLCINSALKMKLSIKMPFVLLKFIWVLFFSFSSSSYYFFGHTQASRSSLAREKTCATTATWAEAATSDP